MDPQKIKEQNQATISGGVGAALGIVVTLILSKITVTPLSPEEASALTAALGVIFSYGIRFLPRPKD